MIRTAKLASKAPRTLWTASFCAAARTRLPTRTAGCAVARGPTVLPGPQTHALKASRGVSTSPARFESKVIKVPPLAESISEGTLSQWIKKPGEFVGRDEPIAVIETDKVDVTVNSPESGKIVEQFSKEGDTIQVGGDLFKVELGDAPAGAAAPAAPPAADPPAAAPPAQPAAAPAQAAPAPPAPPAAKPAAKPAAPEPAAAAPRGERRVKMNRMRLRIAERLKESQNLAASLTTFNEVDMSALVEMRSKYKDAFAETHGAKLGFMSAFVRAASFALREVPQVNARIEGDEMVYSDFHDISVAVATPKGLVTPVLRGCERMSFADVEKELAALGAKARDNKIAIEDLAGGTFTISNGGVFGSLMGTPIINQPQSAILGMHAIKDRPVAVNGKVEIRPMMYLALTYDHRLIDGREAVTFLVKMKQVLEDPRALLLL